MKIAKLKVLPYAVYVAVGGLMVYSGGLFLRGVDSLLGR